MRFDGKVVVVTGASSGVGRAIARAFGAAGAKVALIARTEEALIDCEGEIQRLGGEAMRLPLDLSDSDAVFAAARAVVERWGQLDIWVNDAMVSVFSPVAEMTPAEFRRVTEVNYLGAVYGTMAALEQMRRRDQGVIIQIGSALAYRSIPLQSAYCASKAALRGFTDSLRSELLHDRSGVKLTMLQLPAVNTPQFEVVRTRLDGHPQPVPPIYQPELIAKATLHAALHPRREFWIGWPVVKAIALGAFAWPWFAERYLAKTAYRGQVTDYPVEPNRPDNVDTPIPGDRGAHGEFDDRAKGFSLQWWLNQHRGAVAVGIAGAAVIGFGRRSASLIGGGRRAERGGWFGLRPRFV